MANALAQFIVETPAPYMGDVMGKLNGLGAWFDDVEKHCGAIRLAFRAPEASMREFEMWLSRATDGAGKVHRNV